MVEGAARAGEPLLDVVEQWRSGMRRRPRVLLLNLVALVIVGAWALSMWVAPLTLDHDTVHLTHKGVVGHVDNANVTDAMPGFERWIYHAGDEQCHQLPQRSLSLNGNQMPFCSRCVSIYLLMAIGLAITVLPHLPRYDDITALRWWVVVIALVPIGVDGLGQLYGLWESTNLVRFVTGGLIGAVTGLALGFMLREVGAPLGDMLERRRKGNADRPG